MTIEADAPQTGDVPADVDLVVLGAGPAGLAATRRAAQRGLSVVLVEASPHLGGRSASFDVAGVSVDQGSHRLHPTADDDLVADLRSLLGDDLQTRPRHGRLRVADRWVDFPLRAGELATVLPRRLLASAARDAVLGATRRDRGESYAGVLRAGLGPAVYDAMYGPYAQKLWGLAGEQLDAEQARRRVSADTPWKMAARVVRGGRRHEPAVFHYPRKGFGQIADALAAAAQADGARILTDTSVNAVHARHNGVRVTWDGGQLQARQAFSTLPLRVLGRVARPAPSAQVVADAAGLSFRAMVLVYLVHRGERWTEFDAHYLPGPQTPMSRVSEPKNYRDNPEDPADRTVLCAEIPCAVGDPVWTADEDELVALVERGLAEVGLPPVERVGVEVRRLPRVYPVYTRGYQERLAGLAAWSDRLAHVTTFGRLGLFVHDNTHQAMRMAYDAADCLRPDGGFDHTAWQAARDRATQQVVDD